MEEFSANIGSNRKVNFVAVFSIRLLESNCRSDQLRKIAHGQPGKNLLKQILWFLGMKM